MDHYEGEPIEDGSVYLRGRDGPHVLVCDPEHNLDDQARSGEWPVDDDTLRDLEDRHTKKVLPGVLHFA